MADVVVEQFNKGGILAEGPFYDASTNKLAWVDIYGQSVHFTDLVTKEDEVHNFDARPGAIVKRINHKDCWIINLENKIVSYNDKTKETEVLAELEKDKPKNRLNDAKCDPSQIVVHKVHHLGTGSMYEPENGVFDKGHGTLYSLSKDLQITSHMDGISISNGLAWSADKTIMYYVDTETRGVYAFDFDLTDGTIKNKRIAVTYDDVSPNTGKEHFPDGMCIDAEGKLWIAAWFGAQVMRYDPATNKLIQTVTLPCEQISSCAFGGPNLDELFVTSCGYLKSEEERKRFPQAGSVFRVKNLGVKGTPSLGFEG
ncbi:Regucalcin [Trichoplax sp. H2]|nr:Regucalcin [Trichoplax sp. H2]|eukprot:RDD40684.1 Regucalcin [Trichoplax sp. H2]